jgi:methionyl aminopeptidase
VLELDRIAHAMIREHRATSCYIDYHPSFGAMPFGKVLCVSVNDAVLHGLPHDRRLRDGDLVSLDFAAEVDGWVADSSITIPVGRHATRTCARSRPRSGRSPQGIAAAQPGYRLGDLSAAVGGVIRGAGYQVNIPGAVGRRRSPSLARSRRHAVLQLTRGRGLLSGSVSAEAGVQGGAGHRT